MIREAVIVAAGLGSRLQGLGGGEVVLKPLCRVGDKPLLRWVMEKCARSGIEVVHLVTGFESERLVSAVSSWSLPVQVKPAYNPDFRLSNGISLLVGARQTQGDFVLLMSDHLFQDSTLQTMLQRGLAGDDAVLGVDYKIASVFDLDDATRVATQGDRIVSIGKNIEPYNCVDTGMFVLSKQATVERLEAEVARRGDASISDAMKQFIATRTLCGYDIGQAIWQDVDDPAMFGHAEKLLADGVF